MTLAAAPEWPYTKEQRLAQLLYEADARDFNYDPSWDEIRQNDPVRVHYIKMATRSVAFLAAIEKGEA